MLSYFIKDFNSCLYSAATLLLLVTLYRKHSDLTQLICFLGFSFIIFAVLLRKQLYYFSFIFALVYIGGIVILLFVSQVYVTEQVSKLTIFQKVNPYSLWMVYLSIWFSLRVGNTNVNTVDNSRAFLQECSRSESDVYIIGLIYSSYAIYVFILLFIILGFIYFLAFISRETAARVC